MIPKALVVFSAVLLAAALAVWLFGRPFGGNSNERARAVSDAGMFLEASSRTGHPAYHVAGARQAAHNLWWVEIKERAPRGDPRPAKYACLAIQLDRFHVHRGSNLTVGGVDPSLGRGVRPWLGRCPS